jgi:hypothetical protein
MKDVFARCSKKIVVQVCIVIMCAHSHVISCVSILWLQFLLFGETDS